MSISAVTGSATTATSGTTLDSTSLSVLAGDMVFVGMTENPSLDTITFTQNAGTCVIGGFTNFTQVTNGATLGMTVGWTLVRTAGTLTVRATSDVTIVSAVLVVEVYRGTNTLGGGSNSFANQTSGTNSTGTDEALTVTYSNNQSWMVYFVGAADSLGSIIAGVNQVREQHGEATGGPAGYVGSNEADTTGAPSTMTLHATITTSGAAAVMIGFELRVSQGITHPGWEVVAPDRKDDRLIPVAI